MTKTAAASSKPTPLDAKTTVPAQAHGPQVIDVPRCSTCKSTSVTIVSTQGVPIAGKRWQRQKYRCKNPKCGGYHNLSIVMRGPYGVTVAGDKADAAKVKIDDHRPGPAPKRRSTVHFAGA